MSQPQKSNHRFGEYVFLGALVLVTLIAYNLIAWSQKPPEEQMPAEAAAPAIEPGAMPTDFAGKVQLGNEFMDRGLWDHAIRQYEEALALDDSHADVYVDLGACYHAQGDFETALAEIKQALEIEPDHQIAWFNLGVVQLSLVDTTAARGSWERFLEVAGDLPQADMVRQQLEKM